MKRLGLLLSCAASMGALCLGTPGRVGAFTLLGDQVGNHLTCFKIKDTAPKAVYTFDDFTPIGGLQGCVIKLPARLACFSTIKQNVNPPPPGGGGLASVGGFFCYKVKCSKSGVTVTGSDQFGTRTFTLSSAKLFCAPSSPSGAFVDGASSIF